MYATERQNRIADTVATAGRVSVVALATEYSVATETIRRDLDALERVGVLRRVHGGAIAARRGSLAEPSITERMALNAAAKRSIGTRALSAIRPGYDGSLLIDAGSSTVAFADLLPAHIARVGARIDVVTHAIPVAHSLAAAAGEGLGLTVIGGQVRGLTAAAVGPNTVAALQSLRPDLAVVGVNGISADFGLSTPDPAEAAVKRAAVAAGRRVIVLADSTKFGVESLERFATLDDVDVVVTDVAPPAEMQDALDGAGVEVWVA